ncbi:MAG: AraC family transcriptional regulator ligand-binding domain-containing protein [Marinobacter sp.]|uniref:AraC family transcriptional regulator n=1 Tax=Marinobacter sp. TaxID=50741 RepID=UPI00299D75DC|nr:AraC family transcriptional regulator ligand-binding domain-containing protein [Marinobacter sp.]MDX1755088.1 AraC family transcriptional regulator ligand-binding domain-containing protein [Marinobacter sp.]
MPIPTLPQINSAYVLIALSLNFAPPDRVLEGTGVTSFDLEHSSSTGLPTVRKIVANLVRHSHTPLWPALLGGHLGVATHGPVSYASLSAPTLGKALATFVEWEQLRAQAYRGEIRDLDNEMELVIHDTTGDDAFKSPFFEILVRGMEVLIAQIIGSPARGRTRIHFEAAAADRQPLMNQVYDSELRFGADANKLVVPKSLWSLRSPLYDKGSYELNINKCRQLRDAEAAQGRVDLMVRQHLRDHFEQVIGGASAPLPPPELQELCDRLHVSERTLIRQLKEAGMPYKTILEEERRHFAKQLLIDARYSVLDISDLLGYREPANFCRAFKRWFGVSPGTYRRM